MNDTSQQDPARALRRPFLLHADFRDQLVDPDYARFRPRLTHVLQLLAAGATERSKGTRGVNAGWRRAPLGGNNGYHYYLWWRPAHAVVRGDARAAVEVWGIRHHDETDTPLPLAGEPEIVERWAFLGDVLEEHAGLSVDQVAFVASPEPVRVLEGSPGSGKTSALWQALVEADHPSILYLTFSDALRERALDWLGRPGEDSGFLPSTSRLNAHTIHELVGALAGRNVPRRTVAAAERAFLDALKADGRRFETLARGDEREARVLFHQLYPAVFSPADRGQAPLGVRNDERLWSLHTRGDLAALGVPDLLFEDALVAQEALRHVQDRSRPLPPMTRAIDCIAVDEAQDLTPLEAELLLCVWERLRDERDTPVHLLIAGDEAQTVRPTGFQWSAFNTSVRNHGGDVRRFPLRYCHRSPERLYRVVTRAAELYQNLPRTHRPAGANAIDAEVAEGADVMLATVPDEEAWRETIEALAAHPTTALLVFERDDLGDASLHDLMERGEILRPEHAKGLEYERVVLLGLSAQLERIATLVGDDRQERRLRFELDRLRVSLSRPTHVLAAIEPLWRTSSPRIDDCAALFQVEPATLAFLRAALAPEELDASEQAIAYVRDALATLESLPDRALRRAERAVALVENFGPTLTLETREEVQRGLLHVAVDRWASPAPPDAASMRSFAVAIDEPAFSELLARFPAPLEALVPARRLDLLRDLHLQDGIDARIRPIVLDALRRHRAEWLLDVLRSTADQLAHAEAWVRLPHREIIEGLRPGTDAGAEADTLRLRALDALVAGQRADLVVAFAPALAVAAPDAVIDALLAVGAAPTAIRIASEQGRRREISAKLRAGGEIELALEHLPPAVANDEREQLERLVSLIHTLRELTDNPRVADADRAALGRALAVDAAEVHRRAVRGADALEAAVARVQAREVERNEEEAQARAAREARHQRHLDAQALTFRAEQERLLTRARDLEAAARRAEAAAKEAAAELAEREKRLAAKEEELSALEALLTEEDARLRAERDAIAASKAVFDAERRDAAMASGPLATAEGATTQVADRDASTKPSVKETSTVEEGTLRWLLGSELVSEKDLLPAASRVLGRSVQIGDEVTPDQYLAIRDAVAETRRSSSLNEICSRAGVSRKEVEAVADAVLERRVSFTKALTPDEWRAVVAALQGRR